MDFRNNKEIEQHNKECFAKFREENKELKEKIISKHLTWSQRKELKAAGIKRRNKAAVKAYFEEKKRLAEEAEAAKKAAEEEAARLERLENPTTEDLLKLILAEIKNKETTELSEDPITEKAEESAIENE